VPLANPEPRLLIELFPDLAAELEQLLGSEGEATIANQVTSLPIVDRCRCGNDFCATFYVQRKPEGAYGPGHRSIDLDPGNGMLILDIVEGNIVTVEILRRDAMRRKLIATFP
jgi:hypothetical protein